MGAFRRFSNYDFRHWVAVQAANAQSARIHRLFSLGLQDPDNSWYVARNQRLEIAGYLSDLAIAWEIAEQEGQPALMLRYALIDALLKEVADHLPPELIRTCVRAGIWSREQAIVWSSLSTSPTQTARTLQALLDDALRVDDRIGDAALLAARSIPDGDNRTLAIAKLASTLSRDRLSDLLELVSAEQNIGTRVAGIRDIVRHLPPDLLLVAVNKAQQITKPMFAAVAIAAVAQQLTEPSRSRAWSLCFDRAKDAVSDFEWTPGWYQLAEMVPPEHLLTLLQLFDDTTDEGYQNVLEVSLSHLAADDPDYVRNCGSQPSTTILGRIAVAYARRNRISDAADVCDKIGETSYYEPLLEILPLVKDADWNQWVARFARLPSTRQPEMLRTLAAREQLPPVQLVQLADTSAPQDIHRSYAAIARVLEPSRLAATIDACMAADSWHDVFADLVPYLSSKQCRQILAVQHRISSNTRESVLVRLAHTASVGEAIELSSVPSTIKRERLIARSILFEWISEERRCDIVSNACRVEDCIERIEIFSNISNIPEEIFPAATDSLLDALSEATKSKKLTPRAEDIVERGFNTIVRWAACAPETLWGRILPPGAEQTLARDERWSPTEFVALVSRFTSVTDLSQRSLRLLIRLTTNDPDLGLIACTSIGQIDTDVMSELMQECTDDSAFLAFTRLLVLRLDEATAASGCRRAAAITDPYHRLAALELLLLSAAPAVRDEVVASELLRRAEWREPELSVFAIAVLATASPSQTTSAWEEVTFILTKSKQLRQRVRPLVAAIVGQAPAPVVQLFLDDLPLMALDGAHTLVALAPRLDETQIQLAMRWVLTRGDDERMPALSALFSRALEMRRNDLAMALLKMEARSSVRDAVVENAASELSSEMLHLVVDTLRAEGRLRHNWTLGRLAVRATELDDRQLAMELLDAIGNSRSSWNHSQLLVYRLAPASWVDTLLDRVETLAPYERAAALCELLHHVTDDRRSDFVERIVEESNENRERQHILRFVASDLVNFPGPRFLACWRRALRSGSKKSRVHLLHTLSSFAPTLVAHFGPDIATDLDDAIQLAGQDNWP